MREKVNASSARAAAAKRVGAPPPVEVGQLRRVRVDIPPSHRDRKAFRVLSAGELVLILDVSNEKLAMSGIRDTVEVTLITESKTLFPGLDYWIVEIGTDIV